MQVRGAMVGVVAVLAAGLFAPAGAQNLDKPVWPTLSWLTSTPEEQGMESSALAKLVADGEGQGFDSLLVVRHGRIVAEAYYAPYTADIPHQIQSSTKAVVGTLVGMLHKDGVLDRLDRPMLDFFADRRVANVDDRKKAITVQNLLDMTSGFDWDQGIEEGGKQTIADMVSSSDWTRFILDRAMAHMPGEVFNYADANPNLVSAIVTRLTGQLAEDYARDRLFGPLGITRWHWDRDPQGLTMGAWSLTMLPRDMAKIGYLYLHRGAWEGKQLVSTEWADVLNHTAVDMHAAVDPRLRYSNFFWVFPQDHVYMTVGWHGQMIAVFPDLDAVAVVTAHKFVPFDAVIRGVSAAVKSGTALPPNTVEAERLAKAIGEVAMEKPTAVGPVPEIAAAVSGKTYRFPDNVLQLKSFALFLADARPHFEAQVDVRFPVNMFNFAGTFEVPFGLDGTWHNGAPTPWGISPGHTTAAKGTWRNDRTFDLESQELGFGGASKYVLSFDGRKLRFTRTDPWGHTVSIDGEQAD